MNLMPHELVLGEVYLPPLLLVIVIAYLLTSVISIIATKTGIYKYIAQPAIVELSMVIIFTGLISHFIAII
ncbi:hypothetical protein BCU68_03800 [Vibrio sp. 10N.286.49.B3]|uniref:DUF1656 domain-containing protein n=1 Tax=Vibrio sp. 10N.286.49.B3 TaxID=1880855 RepID=UPI000C81E51C|nr:DUF1656 domain-containing protein [Vibrio sp. 10N.286.49.B3]PMH43122.1 hypothetical protein BCU68_03800 [Vibrio sp. 10N.286.49.B3]